MLKRLGYYHLIWQSNDSTYWAELRKSFRKLILLAQHHYSGLDLSICLKSVQVLQKRKKYLYRGAVFCLPDEKIIKKTFSLSKALTRREIWQVIKARELKECDEKATEYIIDFEILPTPPQDDKYTVCCIAASRSIIDDTQKQFKGFNIKLCGIDVISLMMAKIGGGIG